MITLGITVAAFGSGMTGEVASTVLGPGFTPAEMLAALGAAAVATLGVLIVRILNAPSQNQKPAALAPSIRPKDDGVRKAA
jgi:hypothetical protein